MFNSGPMTPEQITALQRRRDYLKSQISGEPMPGIGGGLAQLGNALAYRHVNSQLDSQFPVAPAGPGAFPNAPPPPNDGTFPPAPQPPQQHPVEPNVAEFQGGLDNRMNTMPFNRDQAPAQSASGSVWATAPAQPQEHSWLGNGLLGNIAGLFKGRSSGGGLY